MVKHCLHGLLALGLVCLMISCTDNGSSGVDGDTVDTADGDTADGDIIESDAADGDVTDKDSADGDVTEETADGDVTEETADGDVTEETAEEDVAEEAAEEDLVEETAEEDLTEEEEPPVTLSGEFVVLAWNDLGMHCLNPTYDEAVILPPYNTVWAQVIKRGNPPEIVTDHMVVSYEIVNNTYSYGKTDNLGGDYAQFWDNVVDLFGISLDHDKGLNLREPDIHNGLSGNMRKTTDHFQVDGIPLTPVDDDGVWNPYQVISVTVRDTAGNQLATATATAPTSDEINCGKCHGANAFADIISKHDTAHGTTLAASKPVLCAGCHGSPALGSADGGTAGYLSKAIHGFHATRGAACQDCHPGDQTKCNRSLAHTAADGNCIACHGTMAQVASGISASRIPWVNEPACSDCHSATIPQVSTGDTLYRDATGHGGLYCATCHGSPHAMLPSREASDNAQAIALQNSSKTIGSCAACHSSSTGPAGDNRRGSIKFNAGDFNETHGGVNPEHRNACHVCHTVVTATTTNWPHGFQWQSRP